MSDVLSFAEMDGQHVELLPARTVLSMFHLADDSVIDSACQTTASPGTQGLLGLLGAQPAYSTLVCQPAVVANNKG